MRLFLTLLLCKRVNPK